MCSVSFEIDHQCPNCGEGDRPVDVRVRKPNKVAELVVNLSCQVCSDTDYFVIDLKELVEEQMFDY